MTPQQMLERIFPGASDEFVEFILWERTPWPCGPITAREVYRKASQYIRATRNLRLLCTFCDRCAAPGKWECKRCAAALKPSP